MNHTHKHSTIQIDLGAIEHNCSIISQHIGKGSCLCAVVKADGYGLGAVRVASRLRQCASLLSVYSQDEAGELLASGVETPVLILAPIHSIDRFHPVYRGITTGLVHLTLHGEDHLQSLVAIANRYGTSLNIHVKIDTGLHRGGCELETAQNLIEKVLEHPRLRLTGIMTHFISAVHDEALTRLQHDRLDQVLQSLSIELPTSCMIHEANTAAMVQWKWTHRSMVRVGLAWTGTVPKGVDPLEGFAPVCSWRTKLAHMRHVPIGERVGYSGLWTANRPSVIGIVPIGYAAGYPIGVGACEHQKAGAFVRVLDDTCTKALGDAPVVGSISMDQIAIDLTDIPCTGIGCGIELISADPSSQATLQRIASVAGVVPHAILSRISPRVHKSYVSTPHAIPSKPEVQVMQLL